jgi:DNA topoisomerase-1
MPDVKQEQSNDKDVKKEEEEEDNVPTPVVSRKKRRRTIVKMEDDDDEKMEEKPATPPKKKVMESDDEESDQEDDDDEFEFDTKKKTRSSAKKTPVKKTPTKKKVVKKEESESESEESEEETPKKRKAPVRRKIVAKKEESESEEESPKKKKAPAKKATTRKTKKEEPATPKKKRGKGKAKKEEDGEDEEEEEEEVYKWWRLDEDELETLLNSDTKWTTLKHNGVLFPPEYEPHGIPVTYDGVDIVLKPNQEEIATMYAVMRETDYYNKPLFQQNFWKFWKEALGDKHKIKSLKKCDFTKIWNWHLTEKEKRLGKSKEEKKAEKEAKDRLEEPFKFCEINGRKEKVGNFRVEPPGLFRGRGEHPKQGFLKKRIRPEDISINIGKRSDAPAPPKGHKWKEVVSNNKVTWLACWKDTITASTKYVNLAASSSFKGVSDFKKYQTARKLKDVIDKIRKEYKKKWDAEDDKSKQLGVAMYFIDKLALRVGNEKDDEEEADTVGCCSLRKEHITLKEPNKIEFDFLGKDSIRYHNVVEVDTKVFKCVKKFIKGKKKDENVFDQINSQILNKELKEFMPELTAKVFRTFNASLTLDKCLTEMDDELEGLSVTDKLAMYNKANREVAILCNHQRTVSKTHEGSMTTMDNRIAAEEEYLEKLKDAKKKMKKKGYEEIKAQWDKEYAELLEEHEEAEKKFNEDQEKLAKEAKKKGVTVSVLTGSAKKAKPPKKPTKKALPKSEDAIKTAIGRVEEKIKKLQSEKQMKEDNKTVALGTSRINYCDPRITVSWCTRNEVPVNKLFSKTLMDKFPWAMDAEQEYRF